MLWELLVNMYILNSIRHNVLL